MADTIVLSLGRRFLPLSRISTPREAIRQFTPNWFTANMGTGILFLDLMAMPLDLPGRHALGQTLWLIDIGLYALFSLMFLGRLILYPETVRPLLLHPVQSMFLGAIPMGLIPIANGFLTFGVEHIGPAAIAVANTLWWVDVVLAVGVGMLVPYYMLAHQAHAAERITPVWLLPIVGPEVTASSGGLIAPHLAPAAAQTMIGTGYVLWALSVPLAFSIVTIALLRYTLHKLPSHDMAASIWLILGPIGTGSLGLLTLGQAAPAAFAGTPLASIAAVARDTGVLGGILLWGAGAWWLVLALAITARYMRQGIQFNMGWWGYTFPLGVYTAATILLGRLTGFAAFSWTGIALTALLAAAWVTVARHTLHGLWHGHLFHAPCLAPSPKTTGKHA
jgi:C4-dicarboxylate transporter/malic acid transport protein